MAVRSLVSLVDHSSFWWTRPRSGPAGIMGSITAGREMENAGVAEGGPKHHSRFVDRTLANPEAGDRSRRCCAASSRKRGLTRIGRSG